MNAASKPDSFSVEARCVRLAGKAENAAALAPMVEKRVLSRAANEVLVEIKASAVNRPTVRVRELTGGRGPEIVFNTVGDAYFQAAHKALALGGRQILIAAINPVVQFNILEFYRGRHTHVGIDTLGLSSVATGDVLREPLPGFASGRLKPFSINPAAVYPAKRPFVAVAGSSRDRVILKP